MDQSIVDVTWTRGPNLPRPVKGQAQGQIGRRIVYACGFAFDTTGYERPAASLSREDLDQLMRPRQIRFCAETWMFDPATCQFTHLPDAPVGVFWAEGTAVGSDFYLLTGTMRSRANARFKGWQPGEKPDLTSPRIFRLRESDSVWRWDELPPMRIGRFIPSVAAVGTTLYVIAGAANFGAEPYSGDRPGPYINAVEALDLAHSESGWRDVAPLPGLGRDGASVAAAHGMIYVFGGFYDHIYHDQKRQGKFCGDAYRYDPGTRRWDQLPDLPFGLEAATAVTAFDRYILLIGGIHGGDRVEHPFTGDRSGKSRANLDIILFDTQHLSYRILPTRLPPGPVNPFDPKYPESDPSSTAKGYWLTKASLIGDDTVYLLGGEVTDLAYSNCSHAMWIGRF